MKKRTFRLVAIAMLMVVCLCATTLIVACKQQSTYYYLSTESNNWAKYDGEVPANVRFVANGDGTYSLTVTLEAGDSFAIYKTGSQDSLVKSIFSSAGKLTLGSDGKVAVGETGRYVLTIDASNGELSYGFTSTGSQTVAVTGVTLNTNQLAMTVGDADVTLTETVAPANATNKSVTWSSSAELVATVSGGVVHAVGEGQATITVTTVDGGKTATCTVDVSAKKGADNVAVEGVSLDQKSLNMTVGDADVTLVATVAPANATNKNVTWSSSDELVATVSGGVVHAVGAGHATITVTTVDGGKTATCTVDVSAAKDPTVDVQFIQFEDDSLEIMVGEEETLSLWIYPDNATDKSYTWSVVSGDLQVVSLEAVDSGLKVSALKAGEVTIKLQSVSNPEVESDEFTITVTPLKATGISVSPETLNLEIGGEADLVATVLPQGAVGNVSFISNGTSIVTVDSQSGHVVALSAGQTTITVLESTSGASVTVTVTVRQPVESISLSISSFTMYGLESTRAITVIFNPEDATNKNFTITVDNDGIVSYDITDTTITLTAKAAGNVRLTITSVDNDQAVAYCDVTVSTEEAVPSLDHDEIVITELGNLSDVVSIVYDGGDINSFTATANASIISITDQTSNSFKVSSSGFGTTTVTVSVSYGSNKTVSLTLTVRVISEYFYLTGPMDGNTDWKTKDSESAARDANMLLEKISDGIYELTRDFAVNDEFYILPAGLDEYWTYGIKSGYYTGSTTYVKYENDNMQILYAGTYTIRLDITGSKASWTIENVAIAPTEASITVDNATLTWNSDTTVANLTLTIGPDNATVDVSNIAWSVDAQYANWLVLVPGANGRSCVATLSYFDGESEVRVTVTVTITVGNFVVTATREIVLMPEGASETPVSTIEFDQESYEFRVEESGWTPQVSAHVNADATNQAITYSIVKGADVYYNSDSGVYAFTINSDTGVITAKQFGTITVRATAVGDGNVSADVEVLIYSDGFILSGQFGEDYNDSNWSNNSLGYTNQKSNSVYEWTEVTLLLNDKVIVLYSMSDWSNGVIRSVDYLSSASTSNAVGGSTGSSDGNFLIQVKGIYTITLDLSGTTPSVKFEKTGDIVEADTWTKTVSVYIYGYSGSWQDDPYAKAENQTITNSNPTVTITTTFNISATWPNIQFVVGGTWLGNNSGITFSGNKYSKTSSNGKWCGNPGSDYLWYQSSNGSLPSTTSFTFVFTFDSTGSLTAVSID